MSRNMKKTATLCLFLAVLSVVYSDKNEKSHEVAFPVEKILNPDERTDSSEVELLATSRQTLFITCSSNKFRWAECKTLGPIDRLWVATQYSNAGCELYTGFYKNYASIIVDKGCRARFGYTMFPGPIKQVQYLICSSYDNNLASCPISGVMKTLYVHRRFSKTVCKPAENYFNGGNKIIVENGCRALFEYTL